MKEIPQRSGKEVSPWHIERMAEPVEPEYAYAPQPESSNVRDYLNVLIKHRRLIILVFLAVFGLTAYINFTATPLYTASSMVQIEPQNPTVTGLAEILSSKPEGSIQYDYYQTQFVLLRSRTLAARVITSLQLAADPTFRAQTVSDAMLGRLISWLFVPLQPLITYGSRLFSSPSPVSPSPSVEERRSAEPNVPPFLVGRYLRYLRVTPVKNTRLVEISFSTPDPRLSQKLADAHAAGFIRLNIDNRAALTDEAREFLDKKNAELRAKLERSEEALNRFRQAHGVVSLDKGENIVVDRLVALNGQLTTARAQRIDAESLYRTVANKKYQDLAQVMKEGSIPQLKGNLATLEAEKAKLSTIFKPDHPRLKELNDHIAAARRSINTEIDNVVRGIESSFVAARAREQALEGEAKKQEEKALELKQVGVQYAVLQEDVNINRSLYESVLKRLNETSVSNDLAISNIQITQRADLPVFASSPQTGSNLLLGAVIGLFLGVGVAFLLDYLDTKMSTPEHVERAVALNTLGIVPDLNGLDRVQIAWSQGNTLFKKIKELRPIRPMIRNGAPQQLLLTRHHPQSIFPESYRSIRTSLLFSRPERPPQIILFTSASPGEGKTGTSVNLGIALAQDGYRVLIIDADLRKGCCHERLGLANHNGLSNILTGNLSLEDGIQSTTVNGLSLLSCGICPPSPADLLGSNKMKEVLTRLRQHYQFIIVDTPPAVALTDASVLSVMADGVVLVFHGKKTTTASARQLIQRLDAVHAPILGVVLNSVDLQNPSYSYYSHYNSYYSANETGHGTEQTGSNAAAKLNDDRAVTDTPAHEEATDQRKMPIDVAVTFSSEKANGSTSNRNASSATSPTSSNERFNEISVEPPITGATVDPASKAHNGPEVIPPESLNRLIASVTKSLGPIGPLVVRDQIAMLGESYDAFPKTRVSELIRSLQHEITQRTNAPVPNPVRDPKIS